MADGGGLWSTDGTDEGTSLVATQGPLACPQDVRCNRMVGYDSASFFLNEDGFWRTDGFSASEILALTDGYYSHDLIAWGGGIAFVSPKSTRGVMVELIEKS